MRTPHKRGYASGVLFPWVHQTSFFSDANSEISFLFSFAFRTHPLRNDTKEASRQRFSLDVLQLESVCVYDNFVIPFDANARDIVMDGMRAREEENKKKLNKISR